MTRLISCSPSRNAPEASPTTSSRKDEENVSIFEDYLLTCVEQGHITKDEASYWLDHPAEIRWETMPAVIIMGEPKRATA